jgi:Chalcone isomerase-like
MMIRPTAFLSITLMKVRGFIAAATCCEMVLSVAGAALHEVSGVSMPEVVTVDGFELRLNGMGLFKEKTFFKVYVAGLYLEKPTADAQAAIDTDEAKRLALVMLPDVSRETFVQAVETGILRNSSVEMPTLRARLDLLEQALPALKKGNVLDFTYLPGAGTLVRGQDKEMTIPGKDFADALFSAWLGTKPANATLKRQLLGE